MESFPRIRGVVPSGTQLEPIILRFSPRMRGCSLERQPQRPDVGLFPAYAGLLPVLAQVTSPALAFPRVRGVVPVMRRMTADPPGLFPAYAGLFLSLTMPPVNDAPFPRVCGVVPPPAANLGGHAAFPASAGLFQTLTLHVQGLSLSPLMRDCSGLEMLTAFLAFLSPLMRGCSTETPGKDREPSLFPASAGLFPLAAVPYPFPATRGVVP